MADSLVAGAGGTLSSPLDTLLGGSGVLGSGNSLTALLQGLFGGQANTSSTSKTSSGSISPEALDILRQIVPAMVTASKSPQFTKEAAIADSQGGVQAILKTLKEQSLPAVKNAEAASGGYNTTTKKLLSNDLTARAAAAGESLVAGNVLNYAQAQNAQTNSLLNAVGLAVNANKQTTGQTDTVGQQNQQGLASNSGVQTTAGILAAIAGLSGVAGVPGLSGLLGKLGQSLGLGAIGGTVPGSAVGDYFPPGTPEGVDMGPDIGVVFPEIPDPDLGSFFDP